MLVLAEIMLNTEPVKYAIIALTAPLWVPFLKALWEEVNDSLREEGGLLGSAPRPEELERLNRERGAFESPLVHEPLDDEPRRAHPAAARAPGRPAAAAGERSRPRRGFDAPRGRGGFDAPRQRGGFDAPRPEGARRAFEPPSDRAPRGFGAGGR